MNTAITSSCIVNFRLLLCANLFGLLGRPAVYPFAIVFHFAVLVTQHAMTPKCSVYERPLVAATIRPAVSPLALGHIVPDIAFIDRVLRSSLPLYRSLAIRHAILEFTIIYVATR